MLSFILALVGWSCLYKYVDTNDSTWWIGAALMFLLSFVALIRRP